MHTHKFRYLGLLLGLTVTLNTTPAMSAIYEIPREPVQSVEDVRRVVKEELPQVLSRAECGLADRDRSLGSEPGPGSFVSNVEGAPGREGEPLGNLQSGMAKRVEQGGILGDGFQFPETADGLSTTCDPRTTSVKRWVWQDPEDGGDGKYVLKTIPDDDPSGKVPTFEDPPCTTFGREADDNQETCYGFCNWLNTFTYEDCQVFKRTPSGGWRCKATARKYTCSEEWATRAVVEPEPEDPNNPDQPRITTTIIERTKITQIDRPTITTTTNSSSSSSSSKESSSTQSSSSEPNFGITTTQSSASSSSSSSSSEPFFGVTTTPTAASSSSEIFMQGITTTPSEPREPPQQIPAVEPFQMQLEDLPLQQSTPPTPSGGSLGRISMQIGNPFVAQLIVNDVPDTPPGVPNCVPCRGKACRCPGPGCSGLLAREETMEPTPLPARDEKVYPSYARLYSIETSREKATDTDALSKTEDIAFCVGFYREFDPKDRKIEKADKRCTMDFAQSHKDLLASQRTEIGNIEREMKDNSLSKTQTSDGAWDRIAGGLAFPNDERMTARNGDLTSFFLEPGMQSVETPGVLMNKAKPEESLTRATDDGVTNETADARPVTQWIQVLQQGAADLLTPFTARLRVPSSWIANVDMRSVRENASSSSSSSVSVQNEDNWGKSVDLQLRAGEDIPGKLIALASQFFTLREEPVTVALPLLAPEEIEANELNWKAYKGRRAALRLTVPASVDLLIEKLDDYEEQIEEYRVLREQRTKLVATLLQENAETRASVIQWIEQNAAAYKEFLRLREERLALAPEVHRLQEQLSRFSDSINMPWCTVTSLTTPIYSLLTPWYPFLPGEPSTLSCSGEEGKLPILCVPPEKDFVFDLSRFSSHPALLTIPVLHPVHIALALPTPPDDLAAEPTDDIVALPDLPPVPTLDENTLQVSTAVTVGEEPPVIEPPEQMDMDPIRASLAKAREILSTREKTYDEYWQNMEARDEAPEDLPCEKWDKAPCVHVEMDLWERDRRATAANVIFAEQLEAQGNPRTDESCKHDDHLCTPTLHETVAPTPTGWQTVTPKNNTSDIDALRTDARRLTITDDGALRKDGGSPPPFKLKTQDMFSIFQPPLTIPLTPTQ